MIDIGYHGQFRAPNKKPFLATEDSEDRTQNSGFSHINLYLFVISVVSVAHFVRGS